MKLVWVAMAALMLLAGCGGSDNKGDAEPEPKVFDVSGTMTLNSAEVIGDGGDGCLGSDGYDDIHEGAPVVVFDDAGKKVGIGELDIGRASTTVTCVFHFTVTDIPDNGKVYSVEVASRGDIPFKRADADAVALSLG